MPEAGPEEAVEASQRRPRPLAFRYGDLPSEREDLQGGIAATADEHPDGGQDCEQEIELGSTMVERIFIVPKLCIADETSVANRLLLHCPASPPIIRSLSVATMLKLFRLIKPYRGYVAIVLVLALAQSLGSLLLPRLMSDIVDKGIVKGDQRAIVQTGGLMLLMSIVATLCAIAGSYYASRVATGFGRILRGAIFARAEHFSIHQFDRFGSASLVTRTTNDTTQVQQMLIMMLTMVITAPMMAIGGVILALSQDTQLAWVLIVVMPVMALVFGLIMRGAIPLSQAMQTKIDRLNPVLGEGLSGVRVIRAFDRGAHQRERFDQANLDLTNTAITVNRLIAFLMPALIVMLNLTSIAIIWFGSHRIDQGTMQVGAMIASLQYAMQILFAVFMVTAMFVMLPRASAAAARINEVLEVAPEIADPANPLQPQAATRRGQVEFQNVTFQYPGAEEPALTGVSFAARP